MLFKKINENMLFFLILAIGFFWAVEAQCKDKKVSNPQPAQIEQAMQQKIQLSPREEKIRLLARQLELEAELKKNKKARARLETPFEKKARLMIEKSEKRTNNYQRKEFEARQFAGITCGAGGDPNSVWVDPEVGQRPWGISAVVRVSNLGRNPVNISLPRFGPVVRNLCGQGSISLTILLHWEYGNYANIPLVAEVMLSDGRMTTSNFNVSLNRGNVNDYSKQLAWQISAY